MRATDQAMRACRILVNEKDAVLQKYNDKQKEWQKVENIYEYFMPIPEAVNKRRIPQQDWITTTLFKRKTIRGSTIIYYGSTMETN